MRQLHFSPFYSIFVSIKSLHYLTVLVINSLYSSFNQINIKTSCASTSYASIPCSLIFSFQHYSFKCTFFSCIKYFRLMNRIYILGTFLRHLFCVDIIYKYYFLFLDDVRILLFLLSLTRYLK